MTWDQLAIVAILVLSLVMFVWGRWRHDMVAGAALLLCVLSGLVPTEQAFAGFGHPAVITVACVLVLSYGLQQTGAVDLLARRVLPPVSSPSLSIFFLTLLAAVLSGFMNNVGALALLMPVALQMAVRLDLPPGRVLMPLAFGSILGGMTTLIGTPPNLIVSGFRYAQGPGHFGMFDFTPVGLSVATLGVIFIGLVGWRLVPGRRQPDAGSFETGSYLTEVRALSSSSAIGKTLREVEAILEKSDAQIVGLVRGDVRVIAPYSRRILREDDILVIEAEPESLGSILSTLGFRLEEDVKVEDSEQEATEETAETEETDHKRKDIANEMLIQELVVMPGSTLVSRTAADIELRSRYNLNLLAISRQGRRSVKRLRSTNIKAGDVLLVQGLVEAISSFASDYQCVPLAKRDIRVPVKGQAWIAIAVFLGAIGLTATGVLPVAIAFASAVLVYMALRIVPPRSVYQAVDWPVIVLLGALLPVADAMASTGAADLLASALLDWLAQGNAVIALTLVLVLTMTMSDFMNNAATAAVMCPLAISISSQLGVSADSFLMAVAIGASCAFLTPIGHQNNTLILGPGGFKFGDYWRLGLPLEILVVAVSVPVLLVVWPL